MSAAEEELERRRGRDNARVAKWRHENRDKHLAQRRRVQATAQKLRAAHPEEYVKLYAEQDKALQWQQKFDRVIAELKKLYADEWRDLLAAET